MRKIVMLVLGVVGVLACEKPAPTCECIGLGGSAGAPVIEPCEGGGGAGGR